MKRICAFIFILLSTSIAYTANVNDVYNLLDDTNYRVSKIEQSVVPSDNRLPVRRSFNSPTVLQELSRLRSEMSYVESQLDTIKTLTWITTIGFIAFAIFMLIMFKHWKTQ